MHIVTENKYIVTVDGNHVFLCYGRELQLLSLKEYYRESNCVFLHC